MQLVKHSRKGVSAMSDELVIPDDLSTRYKVLKKWQTDWHPGVQSPSRLPLDEEVIMIERIARETARADALQDSIKQTCGHDGTCENCGAIPAIQVPYQLCDDCRQERLTVNAELTARAEKLEAALIGVREKQLVDASYCWCYPGFGGEFYHAPYCVAAREALNPPAEQP